MYPNKASQIWWIFHLLLKQKFPSLSFLCVSCINSYIQSWCKTLLKQWKFHTGKSHPQKKRLLPQMVTSVELNVNWYICSKIMPSVPRLTSLSSLQKWASGCIWKKEWIYTTIKGGLSERTGSHWQVGVHIIKRRKVKSKLWWETQTCNFLLPAHKTPLCWYVHLMIAEQLEKRLNAERQDPASELSRITPQWGRLKDTLKCRGGKKNLGTVPPNEASRR